MVALFRFMENHSLDMTPALRGRSLLATGESAL